MEIGECPVTELLPGTGQGFLRRHSPEDKTKYRFLCFKLEETGAVNEGILLLCMLNATSLHNELAKRLLHFYPRLINDIYMADEYFGENVLHIAIVNEDPAMVKFLLNKGVDVHERCFGNFMCPEDQKSSRADVLGTEIVQVSANTNYKGYVYWGEYPLSFAACLGQEECYRLILARGADPDTQDTNGNTTIHMMVIYDKMSMFDLVYECGARIDLVNRLGLTPLTLAAKLAKKDIFFHILKVQREIYWQIGNITCAAYPLPGLDSIDMKTGKIDRNSALNLIAFGENMDHLDMLDGVIVDLLVAKWNAFVKLKFKRMMILFTIYFLLNLACFTLRPAPCGTALATKKVPKTTSGGTQTDLSGPLSALSPGITGAPPSVTGAGPARAPSLPSNVTAIPGPSTEGPSTDAPEANGPTSGTADAAVGPDRVRRQADGQTSDTEGVTEGVAAGRGGSETGGSQERVTKTAESNDAGNVTSSSSSVPANDPSSDTTASPSSPSESPTSSTSSTTSKTPSSPNTRQISKPAAPGSGRPLNQTSPPTSAPEVSKTASDTSGACSCTLYEYRDPWDGVRWTLELLVVAGTVAYVLNALNEARFLGLSMFMENLATVPSRVIFLLSCLLKLAMVVLRLACLSAAEDVLAVLVMLGTAPYFLFFCRGYKSVGPFVTMIYKMIVGDLLRFVTIYTVFVMGFSQAYFIIYRSYQHPDGAPNPMKTPIQSVMLMFLASLNSFGDLYNNLKYTRQKLVGQILFILYMVCVAILLINMLIAMMGNTYQRIAEMKNEWMRQWARIVLVVERGVSPTYRLEHLNLYSKPMADGTPALILRKQQSDEEMEEMKEIAEMRIRHDRNVKRRKQKLLAEQNPGMPIPQDSTTSVRHP
ncbi:transient receptor potential cation channel subfamily V member 5-like [Amphibalanus amphitrite]|uniref:transient receptor potential cation channel subfamily V member 5-like n=1 Tax=Amphibalanus amphitrite TaxID=1232801 RepID=UPI001C90410C|nr:transient receptor potential cation channel subfamily V member 5-like [Amphibalanus amphitrite]